MVKGIFCHYLPMYKDINGIYCSTTLTNDLFSRYFHVVDELIVATRVYTINKTYEEAHQEKLSLPNIKVLEFPNLSTLKNLLTLLPKEKKRLENEIKGVDLIFTRGGIIALMAVDIANKLKKPYLAESAGCAWDEYWNYSFSGKLLAPYMEYRAKKTIKDASFVIYVTEKWLQSRYPTNGVSTNASNVILKDIDEFALNTRIAKITTMGKTLVFGTIGGIGNKAKGQQFMIEAMSTLKNRYDIRYELVGSGDADYLISVAEQFGIKDKIIFKGQLTHNEILKWLDGLDVYVQPSMQEGLPRSLIEAMSRACPAIGSTTAGIPELLENDDIFRRGNVKSLSNAICRVLESDLKCCATRNFEKAKEYEISKLNARRKKIYEHYRDYVVGDESK